MHLGDDFISRKSTFRNAEIKLDLDLCWESQGRYTRNFLQVSYGHF